MGWLASNAIRHCDWRIGLYDLLPAQSRTSTNLREWFRTSFQVQRVLSHVGRRQRPFMLQQPGLACHAAAIAGQLAIGADDPMAGDDRSEEHTSELQSLMRTSYAVFCLKKKKRTY